MCIKSNWKVFYVKRLEERSYFTPKLYTFIVVFCLSLVIHNYNENIFDHSMECCKMYLLLLFYNLCSLF